MKPVLFMICLISILLFASKGAEASVFSSGNELTEVSISCRNELLFSYHLKETGEEIILHRMPDVYASREVNEEFSGVLNEELVKFSKEEVRYESVQKGCWYQEKLFIPGPSLLQVLNQLFKRDEIDEGKVSFTLYLSFPEEESSFGETFSLCFPLELSLNRDTIQVLYLFTEKDSSQEEKVKTTEVQIFSGDQSPYIPPAKYVNEKTEYQYLGFSVSDEKPEAEGCLKEDSFLLSLEEEDNYWVVYEPVKKRVKLPVKLIKQLPEFPTGCESVSAVMALNYIGHNITSAEFIDNYLPRIDSIDEFYKNHPRSEYVFDYFFVGNPRKDSGKVCYGPVITNAVNRYLSDVKDETYMAYDLTGSSLDELEQELLKGNPVIIWFIENFKLKGSGKVYGHPNYWPGHTVLLIGYDEAKKTVIYNDPIHGVKEVKRETVDEFFTLVGKRAVTIKRKE